MKHYDEILKTYAENGLRSAADWLSLGREVENRAQPRAQATHQRAPVALYTRDQTRRKPRVRGGELVG
jgi:hypothetical protein